MGKTGIGIILLIVINLIIYLNRNKGFEYIEALPLEKLYPSVCNNDCIKKWEGTDKKFSLPELEKGLLFLKTKLSWDTIKTDEKKIITIAAYLFQSYRHQLGRPSERLNNLPPLQQLELLSADTSEHLWCGNFQFIFDFFTFSAGLRNRYVEINSYPGVPISGTHEINEIYLDNYKKWIMVDVTRNMILVKKNNSPLSAAEYFNFRLYNKSDTLQILRSASNNSIIFDTLIAEKKREDEFFNKDFFLRYYYITDLHMVYDPFQKIKRYLLPHPWYAIYDPQHTYTNFRFRIKQFFILILGIFLLLYLYSFLKINKK